jgi:hypothetical protein
MNLESLLKLIRSFVRKAQPERLLLADCLDGLIAKLEAKDSAGVADFKTRNALSLRG